MRGLLLAVLVSMALVDASAAAVFCAKPRKGGILNSTVKVREACKPGETQLDGVGCCTAPTSSTTSTSTTGPCPTFTMTSLGIPDCFGSAGSCLGLCANARACFPDPTSGGCGCTGPEQPCGVVTYNGVCGGTCPAGSTCQHYGAPLPNGCTEEPRCQCAPQP